MKILVPLFILGLLVSIATYSISQPVGGGGGGVVPAANVIGTHSGTDITADLEEETHASEHLENAADEILGENLGTACTEDEFLLADATGGLVCTTITVTFASDCSPKASIGNVCVDSDDGLMYIGDGVQAVALSTSSSAEDLDAAFDLGKTIDGANSQANAMVVGDGTDGFRIYVGAGGPIIECFIGAGTCDIKHDIPSGNAYKLDYNGTTGINIDSSGNVTLNNNLIEVRSFWFGSGSMSTDGTQCGDPAEITINSGPKLWSINCADNPGSIVYGSSVMPDSYNGGTVTFEISAVNQNATPSGDLDFDFSAMCRGDSDLIDSTWGTGVPNQITFTTQNDVEQATTAAVTPNGTCASGDMLFWRAVMDDVSTTTQVADTYILGVKLEYPTNDWSDN